MRFVTTVILKPQRLLLGRKDLNRRCWQQRRIQVIHALHDD